MERSIHRQNPKTEGLATIPTATGGIARAAYARLKDAKIDAEPLLNQSHLTAAQIDNPDLRITVHKQIKLLDLGSEGVKRPLPRI